MIKRSILLSVSLALVSIFTAQASTAQKKATTRKEPNARHSFNRARITAFATACYTGVVTPPIQNSTAAAQPSRTSTNDCTQFLPYYRKTNALCFELDSLLRAAKESAEKPAPFSPCSGHFDCWISFTPKPKTKPLSRLQVILNEQLQEAVHG